MQHNSYSSVNAPIYTVQRFHQSVSSLRAITPPLIPMIALEVLNPGVVDLITGS